MAPTTSHATAGLEDDEKGSVRQQEHVPPTLDGAFEAAKEGHAVPTDHDGHAFIEFDRKVESRLVRKLDLHLLPVLWFLYIAAFIDRVNIGNARLAGLEADLGMRGTDYNLAASIFFVAYIIFEMPAQVMSKIYGPHVIMPIATVLFGLFSMCCGFTHSLAQLSGVRFLLGIAEAPMFPAIVFYLSRYYTKDEVATRFAFCIMSAPLAGAFGGLLAAAILTVDNIGWLTRWRMIFFVEGIVTIFIGVAGWFLLPGNIDTASWLSEEEKAVGNARLKAENPGTTVVIEKAKTKTFTDGLSNINSLVCAFIFFWVSVAVQTLAFFLPTIVRQLYPGIGTINQQLRTVPPWIVGGAWEVFIAYVSQRTRNRGYPMAFCGLLMIAGFAMFLGSSRPNVGFAACFIAIMGAFPGGVFCSAWASANQGTDAARATAIGIVVMAGNCGGLVGTWTLLARDAPRYVPAQSINVTAGSVVLIFSLLLMLYQSWENKQRNAGKRDHRLEGKSDDEIALLGSNHPHFRYRH